MAPTMAPTFASDGGDGTVSLENGVPQLNLGGGVDDTFYFKLTTFGALESITCSISGGSGDSDLYTNWDSPVDLNNRESNTVSLL